MDETIATTSPPLLTRERRGSKWTLIRGKLPFNPNLSIQPWVLLCLSCVLTGLIAVQNPPMNPNVVCCDHLFYRSMAFNFFIVTRPELNEPPAGNRLPAVYDDPYYSKWMDPANKLNRQPPYSYRVLTPLLARAIALFAQDNIDVGFYALSFLALALACFFISISVLVASKSFAAAVLAGALFSTTFFLSPFNLNDYMLVDPMAYFFVSVCVFLMLKRKDGLFFVFSLFAVFNKESHFFVLAAYLLVQIYERRFKIESAGMYLSIALAYGLFHAAVGIPVNTYSLATVFVGLPSISGIRASAIATFGFAAYLTASRIWLSRFNLFLTPIAVGAFLSSLFASNSERAYVYAFPLVLLAVLGVQTESTVTRTLSLVPVVAQIVFQWMAVPTAFALALLVVLEAAFLWNYWMSKPQMVVRQRPAAVDVLGT